MNEAIEDAIRAHFAGQVRALQRDLLATRLEGVIVGAAIVFAFVMLVTVHTWYWCVLSGAVVVASGPVARFIARMVYTSRDR